MARSVGDTFATSDSEWLRYLRALKDDWAEAERLLQRLDHYISPSGRNSNPTPSMLAVPQPDPAQLLARIVDLDEKGRVIDASASLTAAEIRDDNPDRASAVNSFVDHLRSCKTTKVSCRVLLLADENSRSGWPATALCLQLLAIELDLALPQTLSIMNWVVDPFEYCASIGVLPSWDSQTLKLGVRRRAYSIASCVASCCVVDTRQFSGHSIDMVAVSLQDFCDLEERFVSTHTRDAIRNSLLGSNLGGLLHIPSASAALSSPKNQDERGLSSLDPIEVFTHLVSHRPSPVSSVAPGTSTTTWLRTLISMSVVTACVDLDRMWSERPAHTEGIDRMAQELSSLHEALQGDIRTVSDFALRLPPPAEKDLGDCISNLQRIAARVKNEEEQTRADSERRSRSTNLEMAQRSIAESRSTIALTVLAAVYLPLSLASSIFGMNVREIDPEHNSIWQFVVVALGIATVTALVWWAWRFFKNSGALTEYLRRQVMEGELAPEDARDLNGFLASRGVERWKRFQYVLGLRSIEKSGAMWDR